MRTVLALLVLAAMSAADRVDLALQRPVSASGEQDDGGNDDGRSRRWDTNCFGLWRLPPPVPRSLKESP